MWNQLASSGVCVLTNQSKLGISFAAQRHKADSGLQWGLEIRNLNQLPVAAAGNEVDESSEIELKVVGYKIKTLSWKMIKPCRTKGDYRVE